VGAVTRKHQQNKASTEARWTRDPRLLPLKDAAEYLGLTLWALRERIWAGQIPVVQFPGGRKMYVDRQDMDKFIEQNKKVIE